MKLFRISLTWQMALATVVGVLFGLFFGEMSKIFAPWGAAYIMILKITTIPYLVCAIIHGIGQLHTAQAIQILKKGLFFIGLTWTINIATIYLIVFLLPYRAGSQLANYVSTEPVSIDFSELLIPDNIFYALTNNVVPAIVIFSLLVGISLMHIREKNPFMQIFEVLVGSLTRITAWISRITPIGTFLIIANQVGTIQLATIKQVSTYIILYVLGICLIVFWIFPRLVSMLANVSAVRWIRDLFPILLLAYTTNVVIVCLPFIIELIKKEVQQFLPTDERAQSQIQGIVSVMFNLPLGSLFITIFVFFISVFYNSPLNLASQLQLFVSAFLTSLGAVGLGAWINSLSFVLETLGLPAEAINIYLTTLPFTSGFQSMLSVVEITSLSLIVTLACHQLLQIRLTRIVRRCAFTLGPVILLTILLKSFNPLPKIENTTQNIFDMCVSYAHPVSCLQPSSTLASIASDEDPLSRILRTKTLRVGCHLDASPFCFANQHQQIVGYDMAFAYQLAADLGCQLILVPMNYQQMPEELAQGLYDIGMSAVSLNEQRLEKVYFSNPYLEAPLVFIANELKKRTLSKSGAFLDIPQLRIGVVKGTSYECLAEMLFPDNPLIPLTSIKDFFENKEADVLLLGELEAISWIIRYPKFAIIHPDPDLLGKDTLGYPVRQGADFFLNFLNQWLTLKKNEGFTQAQYNLWVLGKTETATDQKTPRWSILRNVLHWKK